MDFVVRAGKRLTAIEVKSGRTPEMLPGLSAFAAAFHPGRTILVGGDGIALEEFLAMPASHWVVGVNVDVRNPGSPMWYIPRQRAGPVIYSPGV